MNDLRSQLLKAGAATKKQAHKAKQHKAKVRRNQIEEEPKAAELAAKAVAEQKALDRQLNAEKEALRKSKAAQARLVDLLGAHQLNKTSGETLYNFTLGSRVCRLYTTKKLVGDLIAGRCGVISPDSESLIVVPAAVVTRVLEIDSTIAVSLSAKNADQNDAAADEYADYAIPDDFTW